MKRVFFDILLCLVIFLLPWWVTLFFAVLGLFLFRNYYEFLVFSVVIYLLSSPPPSSLFGNSFLIYLSIIIFYMFIQYLRSHIILYNNEIPFQK
ncbi:TPA: hypothetical protein DCX66_00145 [Candidatus Nomurabacteria bacterium]|nr:hypothetical protein [Candidatus Nomurabacteria bacterium]HAX64879.1 hypothetical protein [Candidatus Nomurabacteria bacterium]HCU01631.1 hypothetical protein [Candidatus Nomurabacteria bacterium]